MKTPYLVGTDIGGTFTDCVVIGDDGEMVIAKAPSTPPNFEEGLWDALEAAAEKMGTDVDDLLAQSHHLSHGTTVATNALINERGARVGFLATKGFEETLWHMRGAAHCQGLPMEAWQNKLANPRPFDLVSPSCVEGISERIDRHGTVLCAINDGEVRDALGRLVDEERVEALAVGFLWSFANAAHEERVRAIARESYPDVPVTLSSELIPILGEYERWSTTALNAFLRPEVETYVSKMLSRFRGLRRAPPVYLMQANGGLSTPERAAISSVKLLQSGPVGGVVGALEVMGSLSTRKVMTADMGGTSFDVCLIDGAPPYTQRSVHNRHALATRMIDIESIGAGGGSIARAVRSNLRVGPDSAGARPGPACYGRGGVEPTVTDANAVLGYLNPGALLGGRMELDLPAAREVVSSRIARPLGMTVDDAALGIVQVVNAHMADLLRFHALRRGQDPRDFLVLCFGGATGLHAAGIAAEIGLSRMVVPLAGAATVFSALGIARTDQMWFFSLSRHVELTREHADALDAAFTELRESAIRQLADEGVPAARLRWRRTAGIRYALQVNELDVAVPAGPITEEKLDAVVRRFDRQYASTFGRDAGYRDRGREVVAVHLVAVRRTPTGPIAPSGDGHSPDAVEAAQIRISERPCCFPGQGWVSTGVYDGDLARAGTVLEGPSVVETEGTTILVPPGWRGTFDPHRHVILEAIP